MSKGSETSLGLTNKTKDRLYDFICKNDIKSLEDVIIFLIEFYQENKELNNMGGKING